MPTSPSPALAVHFPSSREAIGQDEEWCEVEQDGSRRRIRFHDYDDVYSVPGLYEHLFYERLNCQSPAVVAELLAEQVTAAGQERSEIRVLDLGAGNGMVGEELAGHGFRDLVGVDIVPEAGMATERDRPGLYAAYHVCDLLSPPPALGAETFGAMTSVAALGFGDIPPEVFRAGLDLVEDGGWLAFTIKDDFLADEDQSGFGAWLAGALADGTLEERARRRYEHRLGVHGEPLHYVAIVAVKRTVS